MFILEPTQAIISSISCPTLKEAIKPTPLQVSPEQTNHQAQQNPPHTWKVYKPTTKHYRHCWSKCWPELSKTPRRIRTSRNESPDHQEQSRPSRLWKWQLPSLNRTSLSQNTRSQNTPPVTDAGNAHQLSTQCPSRICSSTMSKTDTTRISSWGTEWRKWSDKIPTWHKKFPALMRNLRRSSKRTPSWDWSPRPWPRTCSSGITMVKSRTTTPRRRTFPHGGNHFSKRRSESENKSRKIVKTKITGLKTKETKRTRVKDSWKVKADKVKAERKDLKRSETKRENEKEIKRRQTKTEKFPALKNSVFISSAFTAAFLIFILFYQFQFIMGISHSSCSFQLSFYLPFSRIYISRFPGLRKTFFLQPKPYIWQRKQKRSPQSLGSTRLSRNPETRPTIPVRIYTGTHWFQQHYNIWIRPGFLRIISQNKSIQSLPRST